MYPHETHLLHNTSQVGTRGIGGMGPAVPRDQQVIFFFFLQVDVENPNLDKFPKFAEAPFLSCILSPGETLFIPAKYWHYVRSLDLSFSVSFWWS